MSDNYTNRFNTTLPPLNIPTKEKDEDYHKRYAIALTNRSWGDRMFDYWQSRIQENFDFFDGREDLGKYDFITEDENGDALPAIYTRFNKVRSLIQSLTGELEVAGYTIDVCGINKEFKVAKLDARNELITQIHLMADMMELQNASGLPSADPIPEGMPQTEKEVDEWFKYKYKTKEEKANKAILKALAEKYNWEALRVTLFRDVLIAGFCVVKTEIINGLPKYRRVHPKTFIYDASCEDEYMLDGTYRGEVRWMSMADAASAYNLTLDERKEIENAYEGVPFHKRGEYKWYDTNKVGVVYAEWEDVIKKKAKKSVDKYGNVHYKRVDEGKKGKDIVSREYKVMRKCVVIGGEIVRDWGVDDNMVRSVDDIADTQSSYTVFAPNYGNGNMVSEVDQIKVIQENKNIALYHVQRALAISGSRGFAFDTAQLPDEWEVEDVLSKLKSSGVVFYNSFEDGIQKPNSPVHELDLSLNNSIMSYIQLAQYYDQEMNAITGITPERQGVVNAGSKAAVTNAAIYQSNVMTVHVFSGFHKFCSMVFTKLAGLVKIIAAEEEDYLSQLAGDDVWFFLQQGVDLASNDIAVTIKERPKGLNDAADFHEMITVMVSSGQLDPVSAFRLKQEEDIDYAIDKLEKMMKEKEEAQRQHEMQMQQQQMQMQQQAEMQKMQQEQAHISAEEQAKGQRVNQTRALDNQYRQQQSQQEAQQKAMLQQQEAQLKIREEFMKNNFGNQA